MVGGEPAVGEVFGRYRVEGVLGRGGMATVVLARHVDLGTLHALKIPQLVAEGLLERFVQEGRLQAHLRHPNIVTVTDVVRIGPLPGLVMEYVQGPNLRGLLDRYQPNLQQIDLIADQVMSALEFAHDRQIVHRDVKPENVLLAVENEQVIVKVSDFGLAKVVGEFLDGGRQHPTRTGQTMGTPAYMAPEQQLDALRVDHRADIFSLGAVLYELVSGVPAFPGSSVVEVFNRSSRGQYRPLHELAPSAPERFCRAVRMALRPERDHRPQSVAELRELWRDGTERVTRAWEPTHVSLLRSLAPLPDSRDRTASMRGDLAVVAHQTTPAEDLPVPTAVPVAEPTTPPESTPPESTPPESTPPETLAPPLPRRWPLVAGAGVGLGVMLVLLLVKGLGQPPEAAMEPDPSVAPPIEAPALPVAPASAPDPASAPPAASPPPAVAPVRPPVKRADPVLDPASHPTPVVIEQAPSEPVKAPDPPESAPPTGSARVSVSGVRRAWLVAADGARVPPGGWVPAGSYNLLVWFDEDSPTSALDILLKAGEERSISCSPSLKVCR